MHISSITIDNFRNFQKFEVRDLQASTVFVGANAVGKSNLLHALRLVLDPSLPDSARRLNIDDFWDGCAKPLNGDVIRVQLDLAGIDKDVRAQALLSGCLISGNPMTARLTYEFRPKPTGITETSANEYEFVLFGGGIESVRIDYDVRHGILLRLLPALRDAEDSLQHWSRSPLRPLLERIKFGEGVMDDVRAKIELATELLSQLPEVQRLQSEIDTAMEQLVGGTFSVDTTLRVTPSRGEQLVRMLRVFVDGDKHRPISNASLGQANILFLVLLLLGLDLEFEKDHLAGVMLAVEEPEAHLHPHVQRTIFRNMQKRKHSLLLTTHSPHIVSVTPLESIVLLRADGSAVRGHRIGRGTLSHEQRRDIERYLDVTRAEMLFARGVLLVEGIAEEYLVPQWARNIGINLDEVGISVCSIDGTHFYPFCAMLDKDGFQIPWAVITDGDGSDTNINRPDCGVRRGQKVVADLQRTSADSVNAAIIKGNAAEARRLLESEYYFVGRETLEIDMLPGARGAVLSAFDEVQPSEVARTRFKEVVDGIGDSGNRTAFLNRVSDIGKGRFAQAIVRYDVGRPPLYIESAIRSVFGRCT